MKKLTKPGAKGEIEELRKLMGTHFNLGKIKQDPFVIGCEGIKVKMIDWPRNPYRAMYVLATSCWGDKIDKWSQTEPKYRFQVVQAVLNGEALPLALEVPQFTFVIEGPSRAAFDQIARARLGVVFSARGMRDNSWAGCEFRIPNNIVSNKGISNIYKGVFREVILAYSQATINKSSWQAARAILPMNVVYGWSMAINFQALRGLCANRMKFCEQEDTVATAWLLAKEVKKKFPLLGLYLRPGCDWRGICQYHQSYSLSEMFGCLFKECGRHPCPGKTDNYSIFNKSCSSIELIEKQLDLHLERPNEWPKEVYWDNLELSDKKLFEDKEVI